MESDLILGKNERSTPRGVSRLSSKVKNTHSLYEYIPTVNPFFQLARQSPSLLISSNATESTRYDTEQILALIKGWGAVKDFSFPLSFRKRAFAEMRMSTLFKSTLESVLKEGCESEKRTFEIGPQKPM
ncbi:hypothetical protein V1478_003725 [Vespula squamosa]|uniref:Uncharacterized protein n=1 Tax=Vespula squamosa TaxID=30214 RepID=A0ABD2BMM5_VESSQ